MHSMIRICFIIFCWINQFTGVSSSVSPHWRAKEFKHSGSNSALTALLQSTPSIPVVEKEHEMKPPALVIQIQENRRKSRSESLDSTHSTAAPPTPPTTPVTPSKPIPIPYSDAQLARLKSKEMLRLSAIRESIESSPEWRTSVPVSHEASPEEFEVFPMSHHSRSLENRNLKEASSKLKAKQSISSSESGGDYDYYTFADEEEDKFDRAHHEYISNRRNHYVESQVNEEESVEYDSDFDEANTKNCYSLSF